MFIRRSIITLFLLALVLGMGGCVMAENNKFGIHVTVPTDEDLKRAADLVNGPDGAYGYVTLVIQENNREPHYWQEIFNKLRELKLIPLIRLATQPEGENWRAPSPDDAKEWVDFLGKLNWITKERHVILFNEPNHGAEWGGNVDSTQYGKVAAAFAHELKKQSPDYEVMFAGVDLAAPESRPIYGDAYGFLQESLTEFCKYFTERGMACRDYIDAIASHAYPNPGFVGSPYDSGRTSIRGYQYEITWFESFIQKTLPVYITETGWDAYRLGQDTAASYLVIAFNNVWSQDPRIMAVTPFLLNYQGDPFLPFSFFSQGDTPLPLPKYTQMQALPKVIGTPEIIDTAILVADIPPRLVEESSYKISVAIKNTGQAIWEKGEYQVSLQTPDPKGFQISADSVVLPYLKPFETTYAQLKINTGMSEPIPSGKVSVVVRSSGKTVGSVIPKEVVMEPRPSLALQLTLMSKGLSTGSDFEVQIFDTSEHLVYKKSPVNVTLGRAQVSGVSNIIPGRTYRIVILKPYYLPRQVVMKLGVGENIVAFEPLLPFDFDQDGKFSTGDLKGLLLKNNDADKNFFEKMQLLLP
ncbi:hypothetical protein KBB12_02305 [Candidatus Woesebacteria bacterium]|nr:hypothetical protein [Candidatus Woesebacteria bacterium]